MKVKTLTKVTQVHGTEIDVLNAIKELGPSDPIMVSGKARIGSAYSDYLCRYLARYGFLEKAGRTYSLTAKGEKAIEGRGPYYPKIGQVGFSPQK